MFFRFIGGMRLAVDLDGVFNGSAFLVGGHPDAKPHLHKLEDRGLLTMAMNNTATVFRPTLWVGADKPDHYSASIAADPTIMKFGLIHRAKLQLEGKPWHQYPNMFFVVGVNQDPRNFLMPNRDFAWWKNVFTMGIQLLHRLGISRIYCVGTKFQIDQDNQYSYETALTPEQVDYNQRAYNLALSHFRLLLPHLHKVHLEVISCTPDSALNAHVPYMDIDEAIKLEQARIPEHNTVNCTHPKPSISPPSTPAAHVDLKFRTEPFDEAKVKTTVLMPTYNRDELLELGLMSLRLQIETQPNTSVLVLDEGTSPDTRAICEKYGAKYLHTGGHDQWRVPGFAFNIGAKYAKDSDIFVLTCPEMWHVNDCLRHLIPAVARNPKAVAIPEGYDDNGAYLKAVKECADAEERAEITKKLRSLRTELPFLLAVSKDAYFKLGGYDEDFIGRCYDDDDFIDRLKTAGFEFVMTEAKTVHLHHKRQTLKETKDNDRVEFNKKLFLSRRGTVVRNADREWGVMTTVKGDNSGK